MPIDKAKLSELNTYFNAREEQLFDCFAPLDNYLASQTQDIINPDEGECDLTNPVTAENLRRIDLRANTFRYSMLVAVCTFHEEIMVAICKLAVADYRLKLKPLKGNWIKRHTKLLATECGIDFTPVSNLLETMNDLWTVRNCIVHAWGGAKNVDDKAKLQAAVARLNTVTIPCIQFTTDDELYFDEHDTVSTALTTANDLVEFLVKKLT